jgi:hypothetical protein
LKTEESNSDGAISQAQGLWPMWPMRLEPATNKEDRSKTLNGKSGG